MKKKILFICGSMNITTQMQQIAQELPEYDKYFTPFYADGFIKILNKLKLVEFTIIGDKRAGECCRYLEKQQLPIDYGGTQRDYDLVVTCSDLVVQKNIKDKKRIVVQEGITDPERFSFHLVKTFKFLPKWFAGTSANGISNNFDYYCVAGEGYRELFIRKGVQPEKIRVTGIPNFDNCQKYYDNDFPHKGYVLVCTSDLREKFRYENRKKFIKKALEIANGRQLIFKLHPNEKFERRTAEIKKLAPDALVYTSGSAEEMIANAEALITSYSSTIYVGLALGKEVYSVLDMDELRQLTPVQNGCAARHIADVCRELIGDEQSLDEPISSTKKQIPAHA